MNKHDKLLEDIVKRLRKDKKYLVIDKKFEYCVNGITGEVDIVAMLNPIKYRNRYNFYEIKSHHSHKQYNKAREQYAKYCLTHPMQRIKGVYITPEKVRRLR